MADRVTTAEPLELERHLKLSRISELYDISASTLRRKIQTGELQAIRFGTNGPWRVSERELRAKLVKA